MSATIDTWTGGIGLLTGFCVIAAWLAIAGKPADAPAPSAEIRLGTAATGELAVSPLGRPVLHSTDLRPGEGEASGTVSLRNETPRRLDVAVRATSTQDELDGSAWIELVRANRSFLRSPLGRAHRWSSETLALAPGELRRLAVRVWLPGDATDGWQAGRGDVTLEFRPKVVGR
jgi:hypothetical protein